jgi:LPXTG-motif cell wall-anchored protein
MPLRNSKCIKLIRKFRQGMLVIFCIVSLLASPLQVFAQPETPTVPVQSTATPKPTQTATTQTTQTEVVPSETASPIITDERPQVQFKDVDFRDFPVVRGTFQVRCPTCQPASPLTAEQVKIAEDKMEIQASDLQAEYTGIHLILAVNPTAYWLSHNNKWVSALDYTGQALKRLINRPETNGSDLFEFYSNPDIKKTGMTDGVGFSDLLSEYIKSAKQLESSQASFEAALIALEKDDSGREKFLVYASPIPAYIYLENFQALLKRAQENSIRVYFWTNDPFNMMQTITGKSILEEVRKTGGDVTLFKYEMAALPNPLEMLKGAGYTYKFKYHSFLRGTSKPNLAVSISRPGEKDLVSNMVQGTLQLVAPKIEFIAPPETLHFSLNTDGKTYEPASLPLNISIDFPDGHPRNLKLSTLFMDGSVVQKNEHAPFGGFEVDLQNLITRAELTFRAELEDELGLSTETSTLIVKLEMPESSTQGVSTPTSMQNPLVYAAAGLLALIVGGGFFLTRRKKAVPVELTSEAAAEPAKEEISSIKKLVALLPEKEKWVETYEIQTILASFNRLDNENLPAAEKPALVINPKTLIGRDKTRCEIFYEDPSLDEVHAELLIEEDGSASLRDLNSTAGTWVDFKPLDDKPVRLHHRAILQFGNIRVRFNTRDRVVQGSAAKPAEGSKEGKR